MKKISTVFILLFLISAKSFSQWAELNSGVATTLSSVSVIDINYFWACGPNGVIIRSTNGGVTWQNAASSPINSSVTLNSIYGVSSTNAFALGTTGGSGYVFRTTNGGTEWTVALSQTGGNFNSLCLKPPLGGFLCGNPVLGYWALYSSNSSGGDWQVISPLLPAAGGLAGYKNGMFNSSVKNWFVTNNAVVYYSVNDGFTFTAQNLPSGARSDTTASIWFNYTYAGMTSANTNLYKTSNSGTTWSLVSVPGTGMINGVTGVSLKWWVIRDNKIYYSGNDGSGWSLVYTAPGTSPYTTISSTRLTAGSTAVLAVRADGGISMMTTTTGINEHENTAPEKFQLFQNYPNPFNPVTKIRFTVPETGKSILETGTVVLKVYDILGKEIATLVNGILQPGTYETDFNGSRFNSGIYFYTLETSGYREVRKMILIK